MSTDTTKGVLTVSSGAGSSAPASSAAPAAPAAPPQRSPQQPRPGGPERILPAAPPDDVRQEAADTGRRLFERFRSSTMKRLERRQEAQRRATEQGAPVNELGEPIVGPYVAFDLYAFTPIQIDFLPPYQPGKIIAAGEWAVIYAYLLVNPIVDVQNGFAVPPTVQLAGRWYRVSMDQVNLTTVTDGPDDFQQDQFSSPAPDVTPLEFWFQAQQPGPTPHLFEANLSADIIDMAQPYAAFASTIIDADSGRLQENIPLRYLVYPK